MRPLTPAELAIVNDVRAASLRVDLVELLNRTGGTGRHWRICIRVADADAQAPGSIVKKCSDCAADVLYDPLATVYAEGEILICGVCVPQEALTVANLPPGYGQRVHGSVLRRW